MDTSMSRALARWRPADLLPAEEAGGLLPAENPAVIVIGRPDATPAPAAGAYELRTPRRDPNLESDAWVPGVQAVFTAVGTALASGLLAWGLGWSWKAPVILTAAALAVGWLWRLRVVDRLLWQVETWSDHDLNGDGQTGQPVRQRSFTVANPAQARAALHQEQAAEAAHADQAALIAFVDRCFMAGCAERAHGVAATGPSRERYLRQRDTLLALGIAAWKRADNPRLGWRLAVSRHRAVQTIKRHVL
jgi:hypothetical protein